LPRQASARTGGRLRPGGGGPPLVPARGRPPPGGLPPPLAARRPALRPAPAGAPRGEAGTQARVGPAAGAAPPRRPLEGEVAARDGLGLRPAAEDPLEGDRLPVARPGARTARQGDRGLRRGI